jgi:hypothetical protein
VLALREERLPEKREGGEAPEPEGDGALAPKEEEVVRCARCGHTLALERHRISPDGRHSHTFVNPSGFEFTIRCFREAAGCIGWGEASSFWSWFPGHAWRMALCGACKTHVGWSFAALSAEGPAFVGLIVDRVRQ